MTSEPTLDHRVMHRLGSPCRSNLPTPPPSRWFRSSAACPRRNTCSEPTPPPTVSLTIAEVGHGGDVTHLEAHNKGHSPVLLIDGEHLEGAKETGSSTHRS